MRTKWVFLSAAFLILQSAAFGQEVYPAHGGSMQPAKQGKIPHETGMPMMQFPPLMTMYFPKARVLEVVPVADFIDGADLYRRHCSDCHGIGTTSDIRGMRFGQLSSVVAAKKAGMEQMKLKKDELMAIINALKKSPAS